MLQRISQTFSPKHQIYKIRLSISHGQFIQKTTMGSCQSTTDQTDYYYKVQTTASVHNHKVLSPTCYSQVNKMSVYL